MGMGGMVWTIYANTILGAYSRMCTDAIDGVYRFRNRADPVSVVVSLADTQLVTKTELDTLSALSGCRSGPFLGEVSMSHYWHVTNAVFPQVRYVACKRDMRRLYQDEIFNRTFTYTGRLARSGIDGKLNLIDWFIRRMRSPHAKCPWYFLPFFQPDEAHKEAAKTTFALRRNGPGGSFCLAAIHLLPYRVGTQQRVHTNLVIRNWGASRWLGNMAGIGYMHAALAKELPGWQFGSMTIFASSVLFDLKQPVLEQLAITSTQILKRRQV